MAKFPSQNKIMYAGATVSNGNFAQTHILNVPKDLSILNRRGYASTTRKGVPLIYRVAATVYPSGIDGSGYTTSVSSDVKTTVKFLTCQNNWVMRNAAVKFHAAREKMYADAGVLKRDRGAYSHEIRYNWTASSTTFADPVDGDGAAFTGGTWDVSELPHGGDSSVFLKLVGTAIDEQAADDASALQIGFSYLSSRGTVAADSNLESDSALARFSILENMLSDNPAGHLVNDDIRDAAKGEGDNPPYDEWANDDVNHDITESVEAGRLVLLPQGSGASLPQTVVMDIPFGITEVQMAHRDPGDNSGVTDDLALGLEVLDIYEMTG